LETAPVATLVYLNQSDGNRRAAVTLKRIRIFPGIVSDADGLWPSDQTRLRTFDP
jgi:hypothetical protein